MKPVRREISEYKSVWLVAMFDLPTGEKEERRAYTRFRKHLVSHGFMMLQYSVYARFFASREKADTYKRLVRVAIPADGEVRLMELTDSQFRRMEVFVSRKRQSSEEPKPQLMLF